MEPGIWSILLFVFEPDITVNGTSIYLEVKAGGRNVKILDEQRDVTLEWSRVRDASL